MILWKPRHLHQNINSQINLFEMKQPVYTYLEQRKCLSCGASIADQMHKTQKYCAREVYVDGSIKSCKDQFWSERKKQVKSEFVGMELYHKSCFETLHEVYNLSLPIVSIEDLEKMGIDLSRCAIRRKINDEHRFYYFGFYISHTSDSKNITIIPHNDNLF
jgi:hypothetical protein